MKLSFVVMVIDMKAKTPASIHVIHINQLTRVNLAFLERSEGSDLGTKRLLTEDTAEGQKLGNQETSLHPRLRALRLSAKRSTLTPIFCAIERSRLLIWASAFAGRLHRR